MKMVYLVIAYSLIAGLLTIYAAGLVLRTRKINRALQDGNG